VFHFACCSSIARYITLKAAALVGNAPLFLVLLLVVELSDSIGFVV